MVNAEIIPHSYQKRSFRKESSLNVHRIFHRGGIPDYNVDDVVLNLLDLDSASNLLDLGCGTGSFLLHANAQHPRVKSTGIDIDAPSFKEAATQAIKSGMPISFEQGDVQSLRQDSRFYDRITALHMLSHVSNIDAALSEISRVLATNGTAIVTTNSLHTKPLINTLIGAADRYLINSVRHDHLERFTCENAKPLLEKHFQRLEYFLYKSLINLSNPEMILDYFEVMRTKWKPYPEDHEWDGVMNIIQDCVDHRLRNGPIIEPSIFGAYILRYPR